MASAETLISIFSDLTNEMGTFIGEFESINSRLAAIDLTSPDAGAQIQTLQNERLALIDRINADFIVRYRAAASLVNSSTALIKNQVLPTAKITTLAYENGLGINNQLKKDLETALATATNNAQQRTAAAIERGAFIEANTQEIQGQESREEAAFREANQSDIASEADPEVAKLNRQADEARARNERVAQETASGTGGDTTATSRGIVSGKTSATKRAMKQDLRNFTQKEDWRVRLSLAPGADYLYKSANKDDIGILWPLVDTNGVIFPYTPQISVNYSASYVPTDIAHTNYKIFQYSNSSVDNISVGCEFTAQDTVEAAYLLAVIHFFRSVTKMFYGQDKNAGIPPPLCYLHGLGQFQFDNHPLVITSFQYQLPTDVDYIRTDSEKYVKTGGGGGGTDSRTQVEQNKNKTTSTDPESSRRSASGVPVGGTNNTVDWKKADYKVKPTYVPTKINLSFTANPIITRYDISNNFSLRDYGSGKLLRGSVKPNGNQSGTW